MLLAVVASAQTYDACKINFNTMAGLIAQENKILAKTDTSVSWIYGYTINQDSTQCANNCEWGKAWCEACN